MKEAGEFRIFCPKAEQFMPINGSFEVDLPALARGEQIFLDCDYMRDAQPVREGRFGCLKVSASEVNLNDLITVNGSVNEEKGTLDAQLNCGHCGNNVDLSFPYQDGNTDSQQ